MYMGSRIRHIRPFYSIYIYNISMYRFFSGIAGRKDERKISHYFRRQDARRPSSFVLVDEHRAFARKNDHRAPLKRCEDAKPRCSSFVYERELGTTCPYDSFLHIISFRRKTKQGEEANQTGSHYEIPNGARVTGDDTPNFYSNNKG